MKWFLRLAGTLLILGVLALLFFRYRGDDARTTDAYLTGHIHPVAARITGTVAEVLVDDNQHVEANQVLARIDAVDFEVRKMLAQAQIEQALAQRAAAESQMKQADAAIASARAMREKAAADLKRAKELIGETPRGISTSDYDAARAAYDQATAVVASGEAQRAVAEANRTAAEATTGTGRANLRDAELSLGYTEVRAPVAGRVGRKTVETGARINAGQTLLSLVEDRLWVVANYKETQLRHIAPNAPATFTVDAIPGIVFHGHVESFSPASGAQFSLLPPDNATGNFTKVVQRVPVKILIDAQELARDRERLAPGLSVVADIGPASSKPETTSAAATPATSP